MFSSISTDWESIDICTHHSHAHASNVLKHALTQNDSCIGAYCGPKKYMYLQGLQLWPLSYKQTDNDAEAIELIKGSCTSQHDQLFLMMKDSILWFMAAKWAHFAFPSIELKSSKYAASLMATKPPKDIDIRPPWGAFCIDTALPFLTISGADGQTEQVKNVFVFKYNSIHKDTWSIVAMSQHTTYFRYGLSIGDMVGKNKYDPVDEPLGAFDVPLDSMDKRTMFTILRLVVNSCIAMSDPRRMKSLSKMPRNWSRGPVRESHKPIYRKYVLGKPVIVDCREELAKYISGKKHNSPTVQFLVRGHWRQQACGSSFRQRKLIWIEPHWKGPETGKINVKSHKLRRKLKHRRK